MSKDVYNNLVTLSYLGTDYHGSQIQSNAPTIQGEFQKALEAVLGYLPDIKCCSRTDSGVHAKQFCISFFTENSQNYDKLIGGLNAHLPEAIRVYDAKSVDNDFHARYSSLGKSYEYVVWNSRVMNPFLTDRAHFFCPPIDEKLLDSAAKVFLGTHDFSAFCSKKSDVEDKCRTITRADVRREGDAVYFNFSGDGFLYNMVRIMVGALLQVGRGKLTAEDIEEYLNGKPRDNLLITVPACGLYLTEVLYNFGN